MVAGDESQIVELIIGREAVAPALVFGGDDEGALRQPFLAPHVQADAGEEGHGLHHASDVAADDPASRAPPGGKRREGGGQAIGDRENPVGDVE